jgi:amino acid adenylation domain-containing protein/non-ribosomal peptide synthase protein (TIGR01720 family)
MPSTERLIRFLRGGLSRLTGLDPAEIDGGGSFLDMGADSLALLQISQTVQDGFGIKVPFRLLMDELTTIDKLAEHLAQRLPPEAVPAAPPAAAPVAAATVVAAPVVPAAPVPAASIPVAPPAAAAALLPPAPAAPAPAAAAPAATLPPDTATRPPADGLEAILHRQLDLLGQQLELLRQARAEAPAPVPAPRPPAAAAPAPEPATAAPLPAASPVPPAIASPHLPKPAAEEEEFVPHRPIRRTSDQELTPRQREHLAALIARVNAKTQGSKRIVERDRVHHADSRAVTGFRRLWKELSYPLVVTDAAGARIRDVDGNEYVDLTMGFGSLLFGHSPQFLLDALAQAVPRGVRLGPQSHQAGEVARLIAELTGVERVAFCNSGTEAVMAALRIARAVTGRDKVAIFAGSYHGTADEVLTRAAADEAGGRALPLAPGIPASALADTLVFRYNRPASLAALASHAHELAAVMLEPPRSRTPDVHPLEFLRELRRMTEDNGALLIFDEVVTGFRSHPGGAQAIFGIRADLVTYGKALAAGMPIGVVAGRAACMDTVDGGAWRFGDDSMPEVEMTYHAGTFCKHPYTMAAAKAVLEHLKAAGPALQENLNRRTDALVGTLNDFFAAADYPFKVVSFGSLFRFVYPTSLRLGELFFYHLLEHGVYLWEGRGCFLSTAHTDEDVAQIVAAVKASAAALREGGILPPPGGGEPAVREPAAAGEPAATAPLTEAQEQLWVLTQLGAESSRAYNESMTLDLRGALDVEALRGALAAVVSRHEALRACFAADGAHQRFTPPGPVVLPLVELPAAGGDRQQRIAAWIDEEARQVFVDLENGPLYRARLLRIEEGWHRLVLTLHHLVTDGVSNSIVLQELAQLYGALARGATAAQAAAGLPPAVPFRRYLAQRRAESRGPEAERAEAYWLRQFAPPVPFLELPTDRPRPPLQGHLGGRVWVPAGAELSARAGAFAREQGCTFFVSQLAAWQVLLHRLTGQADLVVGTPAAGQLTAGGGHLVGYCVNLLPLRSRLLPDATVAGCLRGVRAQVLDAFEHQGYPFQRLLKRLGLPRDPSRLPLAAVAFTTEREARLDFSGLETELRSNDNGGSKFELFLTVVEADDELVFDCEFNRYLFDAATVKRWLGQHCQLLAAMAAAPQARVAALPLLGAAERHQLLREWNDTAAAGDRQLLIHQLFEAQVARAPEAPAVDFGAARLSYRELNAEANRLAHHLASLGVERGSPVAILLRRSLAVVPALLGVLKAGGAYVPLDPDHPAERLHWLLAAHDVPVVITQASELATLAAGERRLPALRQVIALDVAGGGKSSPLARVPLAGRRELAAQPDTNLPARAAAGDLAYVIFTSGSTGVPKGVMESHQPVVNLIRWVNDAYAVGPADRLLFVTSLGFDLSVYDVFGLLAAGGSIRVAAEGDLRDPERLIAWLVEDGITIWDSAPAALQQLIPFLPGALPAGVEPRLRLVLQSGDWIPLALPAQLRQHFRAASLVALGGATEATVWSNHHLVRGVPPHWRSIPYGRPIANARYYLLDAELGPAPLGVAGDLFIGGECLSSGYAGDPTLTAAAWLPDPAAAAAGARMYRTGDRARFLPDGEIEFLGRLDSQVKVRGFRVELGEIETVLARHPAIGAVAVAARSAWQDAGATSGGSGPGAGGWRDGEAAGDKRLAAYVVPRAAMPPVDELRAYLKQRLPEHMVPAVFVPLAALPVTANGKLDRAALPAPDPGRPEISIGFEPPATPAEERLAAIWRQALGVERVGRRDSFFELGGDSILAVRIVAQARRAGLPLGPADVFQYPTIAELASLAAAADAPAAAEVPLLPMQRWFFARRLPRPQHYNQALLLTAPAALSAALVERAFAALLRRHAALTMRYERGAEGWRQVAGGPRAAVRCPLVDLGALAAAGRAAATTAACAALQAGLDLERGRLARLALLAGGGGEPQRLAIVVHHLATDVTSWQVLVTDLWAACEQLRAGAPVELAPPTTPVREWAARLAGYARSGEVASQIPLWSAAAHRRVKPLPRDLAAGDDTAGSARQVAGELDAGETRALLREAPRAYRALAQEVLLTALAQALGAWTGESSLLVDLEGNGRELDLAGMNLGRTVGWFTTLYPVVLELPAGASPGAALQAIKARLRAIPQEGIGYGLLRFGERREVAERLAALPPAEVSFLYLGGLAEAAAAGGGFARAGESTGPAVAPSNPRSHLLEVHAAVSAGRLRTVFTYSACRHRPETVEGLVAAFLAALRCLIEDCRQAAAGKPTPADFPRADVSQDELDELLIHFGSTVSEDGSP